MRAKQSLGQNFLQHQATADRIADSAELTRNDTVLEIGPGTGMLTRALLARAGKVIAVEADHSLIPVLSETFSEELGGGKLTLIEDDIRAFDMGKIAGPYKVVANIPYYITGEIIRKLLTASNKATSVTLLVQKEVAERIARSKKESLLSLSVKVFGKPSIRFLVPRGAFHPAPNVDSAVLAITDIESPFANNAEEERFFEVLHAGFAHKRKQLGKNLESLASSEAVLNALDQAHLAPTVRAEDVSLSLWLVLAKAL